MHGQAQPLLTRQIANRRQFIPAFIDLPVKMGQRWVRNIGGQLTGQPAINLRPVSPDRFEVVEVPASLEFPAGPAPATVTLRQNGAEIVFTRKP